MRLFLAVAALVLGLFPPTRVAAVTFVIPMDGLQVVDPATGEGGAGHPTATGVATVLLDPASDSASWSLSLPLELVSFTTAGIYRDLGGQADPLLIEFTGLLGGPLVDTDVDAVLMYPTLYYVQLANAAYPAGAIRGQLPEPGTLGMLGSALGGVALLRRRIAARA
jgi:hypothetical protein